MLYGRFHWQTQAKFPCVKYVYMYLTMTFKTPVLHFLLSFFCVCVLILQYYQEVLSLPWNKLCFGVIILTQGPFTSFFNRVSQCSSLDGVCSFVNEWNFRKTLVCGLLCRENLYGLVQSKPQNQQKQMEKK